MKRFSIGLFLLLLCFIVIGCSANPNSVEGSFMYGYRLGSFK